MTSYYGIHAQIYDSTRWKFLFGRDRLVSDIEIQPGETVLDVGCGTGKHFSRIQESLRGTGKLLGIDCSIPMLKQCRRTIERHAWTNVDLSDVEYGHKPLNAGNADVVLMSYSLSMIPDWRSALECAHRE